MKLNEGVIRGLVRSIKLGSWQGDACAVVGIHPATLRRWMEAGERLAEREGEMSEREELLVKLWREVKRAEGAAIEERLRRIRKAGRGGAWAADAWWLERRHPGKFGRRVDVGIQDGSVLRDFTADELREADRQLALWAEGAEGGDE